MVLSCLARAWATLYRSRELEKFRLRETDVRALDFAILPILVQQRELMSQHEQELLKELKSAMKTKFQKDCVDAYLNSPTQLAIVRTTLEKLEKALNEAR